MIKVNVSKQSNYPVSSVKVRKFLKNFFKKKGITSDAEVSVAIVGAEKMLSVGKKYLGDKELHNVLSFTPEESSAEFVYPPDAVIHLGEIIICYPQVFEEAKKENKLIEQKFLELVEHGALHLMGEHHQ